MKQTLQAIGLLIVSGVSAWTCGEVAAINFPFAAFCGAVAIGCGITVPFILGLTE